MSHTHKDTVGKFGNLQHQGWPRHHTGSSGVSHTGKYRHKDGRVRIFWGFKAKPVKLHRYDQLENDFVEDVSKEIYGG